MMPISQKKSQRLIVTRSKSGINPISPTCKQVSTMSDFLYFEKVAMTFPVSRFSFLVLNWYVHVSVCEYLSFMESLVTVIRVDLTGIKNLVRRRPEICKSSFAGDNGRFAQIRRHASTACLATVPLICSLSNGTVRF